MQAASRLFVIFFVVIHVFSAGKVFSEEISAPAQVMGFADSLFEEGDYFRAISEYKRFIYLYPLDNLSEKASFRIAESYFKAKRWSETIDACNQFLAGHPTSPLYNEFIYLKGKAEKQDKKFDDAIRTFDIIEKKNISNYSDRAIIQKALIMLERSDWQGTRDFLMMVPRDSALFSTAESFYSDLANADKLTYKSPVTAGLLASLLPGAGHLYTERPKDALTAFLLNGAFIWGAVEMFHHDNYAAGGILSFFELGWYSGNIYSAVNSAHKFNRKQEDDLINRLTEKYSVGFLRNHETSSILLSRRF